VPARNGMIPAPFGSKVITLISPANIVMLQVTAQEGLELVSLAS
jgi:hypothetical protein